MWDSTRVVFHEVPNMEGLNFAIHYFGEPFEFFISPSYAEALQKGEVKELQYVQLSFERPGRDVHADAKLIVDEFKKMPDGNVKDLQFNLREKLKEFDEERTGQQRVIVSPKFYPND